MDNNMIYVTSASDHTLVMFVPELQLSKTWTKRGQRYPIARETLIQAYYNTAVEYLFKEGLLVVTDEDFLKEVGLMTEEGECEIIPLTSELENRIIKHMPLAEVKNYLEKLTKTQLRELAEFAVEHYAELKMDRVDILSQFTGKNILKAIENYKIAQEG